MLAYLVMQILTISSVLINKCIYNLM